MAAFENLMNLWKLNILLLKQGIDIGDTSIGMHVKHVQVPLRLSIRTLGAAHVTALYSRPKYIGGPRAHYETTKNEIVKISFFSFYKHLMNLP